MLVLGQMGRVLDKIVMVVVVVVERDNWTREMELDSLDKVVP
jgi:hypothetical protein